MRMTLSTALETPAEHAWAKVRMTRLFEHVARPVLTIEPLNPPVLPAEWREGTYHIRMRLFGIIPIGEQWIVGSEMMTGPDHYQFRDNGRGGLASRWDHRITLKALGPSRCRYTDTIDIGAGILTPLVWLFARLFFAHRQRRWRELVRRDLAY